MKMLIIGFMALLCSGSNNVNKEHYMAKTEKILKPMDHQRRIGEVDLYKLTDNKFNKKESDLNSERFNSSVNELEISSIKDKKVLSKPTEGPGGKKEVVDDLAWFFDIYEISGGIVAVIILFAGIRFFSRG